MSTATKVIIKFQIFSSLILILGLAVVNYGFWKLGLSQYYTKIQRLEASYQNFKGKGGIYRSWQILNNDCFEMYGGKYCLSNMQKVKNNIYKSGDKYFLIDNKIAFDITDFFELHVLLIKLSFYIVLFYLFVSYPLGRWFLASIYSKLFEAIRFLKNGQLIDIHKLEIPKDDELYLLFQTINNQFESISFFNKYLSHEIKTPLMNLLSSLELLKTQGKISQKDFNEFKKEVFHIKNVIDMFGKLMLLERGNLKTPMQPISLCDYIKYIADKFQLEIKLECNSHNKILANEDLLKMILSNIFSNIKKYSKGKAIVYINNDGILFENPSAPIKNVSDLTKKFYKEGSASGMGIGLYLIKKGAELLGWKINISFENGKFKVLIEF